jgi:hypothetical protein
MATGVSCDGLACRMYGYARVRMNAAMCLPARPYVFNFKNILKINEALILKQSGKIKLQNNNIFRLRMLILLSNCSTYSILKEEYQMNFENKRMHYTLL